MEQVEAGFIAAEIKRLIAFTGGMFTWSDFVVLLRYSAHSRLIEAALQKEAIPHRVLAGHKFFERMEVRAKMFHHCMPRLTQTLGQRSRRLPSSN